MCIGIAFLSRITHIGQATSFFFFFLGGGGGGGWWMMNGWWMDNDVNVIHTHHIYVDITMLSKTYVGLAISSHHISISVFPILWIQIICIGLAMLSRIIHRPNYLLINKLFSKMHINIKLSMAWSNPHLLLIFSGIPWSKRLRIFSFPS